VSLRWDVENVSSEFAGGFDRVDHLPSQMRRVHLEADIRRILERAEEGCECHGAGGDIGGIDVGLPEDSDSVFLAGGEVLRFVSLHNRLDLLIE